MTEKPPIEIIEQGKSGKLYGFNAKSLSVTALLTEPVIHMVCRNVRGDKFTVDEAEQVALHLLALVETARSRQPAQTQGNPVMEVEG